MALIGVVVMSLPCRRSVGMKMDQDSEGRKMEYKDFIWFLLSEEDKANPRR